MLDGLYKALGYGAEVKGNQLPSTEANVAIVAQASTTAAVASSSNYTVQQLQSASCVPTAASGSNDNMPPSTLNSKPVAPVPTASAVQKLSPVIEEPAKSRMSTVQMDSSSIPATQSLSTNSAVSSSSAISLEALRNLADGDRFDRLIKAIARGELVVRPALNTGNALTNALAKIPGVAFTFGTAAANYVPTLINLSAKKPINEINEILATRILRQDKTPYQLFVDDQHKKMDIVQFTIQIASDFPDLKESCFTWLDLMAVNKAVNGASFTPEILDNTIFKKIDEETYPALANLKAQEEARIENNIMEAKFKDKELSLIREEAEIELRKAALAKEIQEESEAIMKQAELLKIEATKVAESMSETSAEKARLENMSSTIAIDKEKALKEGLLQQRAIETKQAELKNKELQLKEAEDLEVKKLAERTKKNISENKKLSDEKVNNDKAYIAQQLALKKIEAQLEVKAKAVSEREKELSKREHNLELEQRQNLAFLNDSMAAAAELKDERNAFEKEVAMSNGVSLVRAAANKNVKEASANVKDLLKVEKIDFTVQEEGGTAMYHLACDPKKHNLLALIALKFTDDFNSGLLWQESKKPSTVLQTFCRHIDTFEESFQTLDLIHKYGNGFVKSALHNIKNSKVPERVDERQGLKKYTDWASGIEAEKLAAVTQNHGHTAAASSSRG